MLTFLGFSCFFSDELYQSISTAFLLDSYRDFDSAI